MDSNLETTVTFDTTESEREASLTQHQGACWGSSQAQHSSSTAVSTGRDRALQLIVLWLLYHPLGRGRISAALPSQDPTAQARDGHNSARQQAQRSELSISASRPLAQNTPPILSFFCKRAYLDFVFLSCLWLCYSLHVQNHSSLLFPNTLNLLVQ